MAISSGFSRARSEGFALLGVYGQSIFVDPELKLVMVITAAAKNASVGKEPFAAERERALARDRRQIRKLVAHGHRQQLSLEKRDVPEHYRF